MMQYSKYYALTNLILTTTPGHRQYDYDEEIEAWTS